MGRPLKISGRLNHERRFVTFCQGWLHDTGNLGTAVIHVVSYIAQQSIVLTNLIHWLMGEKEIVLGSFGYKALK